MFFCVEKYLTIKILGLSRHGLGLGLFILKVSVSEVVLSVSKGQVSVSDDEAETPSLLSHMVVEK